MNAKTRNLNLLQKGSLVGCGKKPSKKPFRHLLPKVVGKHTSESVRLQENNFFHLATYFHQGYKNWVKKNGEEGLLPGLNKTSDQLLFISFAQVWASVGVKLEREGRGRRGGKGRGKSKGGRRKKGKRKSVKEGGRGRVGKGREESEGRGEGKGRKGKGGE